MLKKFKQRGQVLVLYAFFVPTILIFMGAAMEFGWWFFNQSRLQNAADAAVLAGANQIIDGYKHTSADRSTTLQVEFVNKRPNDDSLTRKSDKEIPTFNDNAAAVTETAEDYADKNFDYENFRQDDFFQDYAYVDADNFNDFSNYETNVLKPLYYVVELKGKVNHLFGIMERNFGDMNLHVVAVTRISGGAVVVPDSGPVIPDGFNGAMDKKETSTVIIGNWEIQDWYYKNRNTDNWKNKYAAIYGKETLFNGKWNHFQSANKLINNTAQRGAAYKDHKKRKERPSVYEENLDIYDGSPNTYSTSANGDAKYNADEIESLNLDFTQDINVILKKRPLTEDWDIGYPESTEEIERIDVIKNGSKTTRTHSQFSFGAPYETRPNQTYPDPLGVRVESEPMWSALGTKTQTNLNAVRQIFLNFNESNMSDEDDSTTYRPLVIYYTGPETNTANPNLTAAQRNSSKEKSVAAAATKIYYDEKGVKYVNGVPYDSDETPAIRDSQPVIVNLNADFSGILYMPYSPVVLNGNGNNFKGFIVAKKYLLLKTEKDFEESGGKYYGNVYDKAGNLVGRKEYFRLEDNVNGFKNVMFVDDTNNIQYKNVPKNYTYQYGEFETFGDNLLQDNFFTQNNPYANFAVQKLSYNLLTYSDHAETEDD